MPITLADLRAALASKQALSTDLSAARAEIDLLQARCTTAETSLAAEKTRADGLQLELDQAQTDINALTSEVTGLKATAQTAGEKAADTLNQLGVSASELPPSADLGSVSPDEQITSLRAQILKSTDPKIKGALAAQIKQLHGKN